MEGALPLIRNLPSLVVRTQNGMGYCADHISMCIHDDRYCVSFISSGNLVILPAEKIAAIEYSATGRSWCNGCDQSLVNCTRNNPPEWAVPSKEAQS